MRRTERLLHQGPYSASSTLRTRRRGDNTSVSTRSGHELLSPAAPRSRQEVTLSVPDALEALDIELKAAQRKAEGVGGSDDAGSEGPETGAAQTAQNTTQRRPYAMKPSKTLADHLMALAPYSSSQVGTIERFFASLVWRQNRRKRKIKEMTQLAQGRYDSDDDAQEEIEDEGGDPADQFHLLERANKYNLNVLGRRRALWEASSLDFDPSSFTRSLRPEQLETALVDLLLTEVGACDCKEKPAHKRDKRCWCVGPAPVYGIITLAMPNGPRGSKMRLSRRLEQQDFLRSDLVRFARRRTDLTFDVESEDVKGEYTKADGELPPDRVDEALWRGEGTPGEGILAASLNDAM